MHSPPRARRRCDARSTRRSSTSDSASVGRAIAAAVPSRRRRPRSGLRRRTVLGPWIGLGAGGDRRTSWVGAAQALGLIGDRARRHDGSTVRFAASTAAGVSTSDDRRSRLRSPSRARWQRLRRASMRPGPGIPPSLDAGQPVPFGDAFWPTSSRSNAREPVAAPTARSLPAPPAGDHVPCERIKSS